MYLQKVTVHGFRAASEDPLACLLPGRFAVLAGANSAGKSTIVDSIVLAHRNVFPFVPRPSAAALSKNVPARTIDVEYVLEEDDNSALGALCASTVQIPSWSTSLSSSMGRVSASAAGSLGEGQLPVLYLSPTRNPSFDLGGRESRLIVELLRSQALRDRGDKSLKELRGLLGGLISSVVNKWPVAAAEARVAITLAELTDGVAGRVPYLGTGSIDDAFLARIFEFLLATVGLSRADSHRLETEGLGYANLLQLAVILAAIPDLSGASGGADADSDDEADASPPAEATTEEIGADDGERTHEELVELMTQADEQRELEDDTFFANVFHAVVVLEEPEAHLHPQQQHGLVRYLKEVVEQRPEVQVILTTHSDEIVAACDPEDLVILRRDGSGKPSARTIKEFGLSETMLDQARRHLDVNRSASLFAERSVLVEGITDAIVLRAVARVWAGNDRIRRRFVDALTISVVGSRIGPWLPDLLTRSGDEIVEKLAILRDSDGKLPPKWVVNRKGEHFRVFFSKPTLEPSITPGNESTVRSVLESLVSEDVDIPADADLKAWATTWFKKQGKGMKARFADGFAKACRDSPDGIEVPSHLGELLDFVWEGFLPAPEAAEANEDDDETATE